MRRSFLVGYPGILGNIRYACVKTAWVKDSVTVNVLLWLLREA